MAAADFNVADRAPVGGFPVTAGKKITETVQATPDADARAAATAANVSNAAYIGYAAALAAHEARTDIESLADRRTRENGTTFAAADFMRRAAYNADGTAKAPPTPGNVNGVAPSSS